MSNTPHSGVPHLLHEVYVVDRTLIMNPVGVTYLDATQQNMAAFRLPPTQAAFGAILYQFYEQNLRAALPQAQHLDFAKKKLDESVQLAATLRQEHIDNAAADVTARYAQFKLPEKELFNDAELTDEQKANIAAQYVMRDFAERLSQPVRKVYGLCSIMDEPEQEQLRVIIPEYTAKYDTLQQSVQTPLAKQKLAEFKTGLEAMLHKRSDVRL